MYVKTLVVGSIAAVLSFPLSAEWSAIPAGAEDVASLVMAPINSNDESYIGLAFLHTDCSDVSLFVGAEYSGDKEEGVYNVVDSFTMRMRIDKGSVWHANKESTSIKYVDDMVIISTPVALSFVDDVMKGNTLRIKAMDDAVFSASLAGSSQAINEAIGSCFNASEAYFPDIDPGESDEAYFSL